MITYTHRFWATHSQPDNTGTLRDYATLHCFDFLPEARGAHDRAAAGHWLTGNQTNGHLSSLHTYQNNNRLPEQHKPETDINP